MRDSLTKLSSVCFLECKIFDVENIGVEDNIVMELRTYTKNIIVFNRGFTRVVKGKFNNRQDAEIARKELGERFPNKTIRQPLN